MKKIKSRSLSRIFLITVWSLSFLLTLTLTCLGGTVSFASESVKESTTDLSLFSSPIREVFLESIRRGALSGHDIAQDLNSSLPGINSPGIENGLFALESDLLDKFAQLSDSSSRLRSLNSSGSVNTVNSRGEEKDSRSLLTRLEEYWKFSSDEAFDILLYYAGQVFSDDPSLLGEPRLFFSRLQELSRQEFRSQNWTRFKYFQNYITQLSVPQMAADLGISQSQVYRELYQFEISIVESFNRELSEVEKTKLDELAAQYLKGRNVGSFGPLESALEGLPSQVLPYWMFLSKKGVPAPVLMSWSQQVLGFGSQALEFVFHHLGFLPRGESWDTALQFGDQIVLESELLVRLHSQGLTHAEIALRLNALRPFNEWSLSNGVKLRTEASIAHKLSQLGLSKKVQRDDQDLFLPNYGYLKKKGQLIVQTVFQFFVDHQGKSDEWMAEQLEVPVLRLNQYFKAHHFIRWGKNQNGKSRLSKLFQKRLEQSAACELVFSWIMDPQKGNGRTPIKRDFGSSEGQIEVGYDRLFGVGTNYGPTGKLRQYAIFSSSSEAVLAIYDYALARGVELSLLDAQVQDRSQRLLEIQKAQNLEMIFSWIIDPQKGNGRIPKWRDFGSSEGQIEVGYDRLFGVGTYYGPTGRRRPYAIFSNPSEAVLAIYDYALARGVELSLLDSQVKERSQRLLEIQKVQSLAMIFSWIVDPQKGNGRIPIQRDFGSSEGQIEVKYDRLFGVGTNYGPMGKLRQYAIFSNSSEAVLAIYHHALARRVELSLLGVHVQDRSQRLLEIQKAQNLEIIFSWIVDPKKGNGRIPLSTDFFRSESKVGVSYSRLFGVDMYGPTGKLRQYAIFSSPSEAVLAIYDYALARGVKLSLLGAQVQDRSQRLLEIQKAQNLEMIFSWIIDPQKGNGRIPIQRDFGSSEGQIEVKYERFFGVGTNYGPTGRQRQYAIFSSSSEAVLAIYDYALARGVELSLLDSQINDKSPRFLEIQQAQSSGPLNDKDIKLKCSNVLR